MRPRSVSHPLPEVDRGELRRAAVAVVTTTTRRDAIRDAWDRDGWGHAVVAIGLSRIDVPRAVTELRAGLGTGWHTGRGGGPEQQQPANAIARPGDRRADREIAESFVAEPFDHWSACTAGWPVCPTPTRSGSSSSTPRGVSGSDDPTRRAMPYLRVGHHRVRDVFASSGSG